MTYNKLVYNIMSPNILLSHVGGWSLHRFLNDNNFRCGAKYCLQMGNGKLLYYKSWPNSLTYTKSGNFYNTSTCIDIVSYTWQAFHNNYYVSMFYMEKKHGLHKHSSINTYQVNKQPITL